MVHVIDFPSYIHSFTHLHVFFVTLYSLIHLLAITVIELSGYWLTTNSFDTGL